MKLVYAKSAKDDMSTALVAVGSPFNNPNLHLFKNDFSPGASNELVDFVEADFDGYAAQAVALIGGHYGPDGEFYNSFAPAPWIMSGETHPQTVFGWFLTDVTNDLLLASARFDAPVYLAHTSDGFNQILELSINQAGGGVVGP